MKNKMIVAGALFLAATGLVQAALITGESVHDFSSELSAVYTATNMVNESGLTFQSADVWHHEADEESVTYIAGLTNVAWLEFDLGEVTTLTEIHLWNGNDAKAGRRDRGAKTIDVYVSNDPGTAGNNTADGTWGTKIATISPGMGPGSNDYEGERFDITDTEGRYVRLDITENHGDSYTALNEVHFYAPPVVPLFQDTFDRADSDDIDSSTNGMSGIAAPMTYWESDTIAGNNLLTQVTNSALNMAFGPNASVVGLTSHNFIDSEILIWGGFSVSANISDLGTSTDDNRWCGFGVGMSSNEINALELDRSSNNGPRGLFDGSKTGVADFYASWTPNSGGGVQLFFSNTSGGTQFNVSAPTGGLLQADFFFDSFQSGSNVDVVVYFDSIPISTNQFAWNGDYENYLALSCRQNADGMTVDNLSVASPIGSAPPPPAVILGDDTYQVLLNSSSNSLDVLRNDTGTGLSIISVSIPSNGTASVAGSHINYVPSADFAGMDYFDYTTVDAGSITNTETVTIDVREYPNFVFILTDDQGWTSLSAQTDLNRGNSKSDYHLTPNMDALATSGLRFSRGYSPAPNCSPSRYANLTGKTTVRLGFTDISARNVDPTPDTDYLLISPGKKVSEIQTLETTTPELLQSIPGADYRTAHWGKWHINGGGPAAHGFDEGDGATGNGTGNNNVPGDPKLAFSITARANAFMADEVTSGKPFYCQVSHYAPHIGTEYLPATYDSYDAIPKGALHDNQGYAAMITDLDTAVGQLLDRIDELGIRNSTYIIFTSDNGAVLSNTSNLPLRGYKPEVWEGGTRVPTFVRGPEITAGTQYDQPVMGVDILPTIWEWATGSTTGLPANLDGGSWVQTIRDVSTGNPPSRIERTGELVGYTPHYVVTSTKDQRPRVVMHDNDYKLVVQYEIGTIELYNLTDRIEEDDDRAGIDIGKRWEMWVRLRDYMKQVDALIALPDADNWPGSDGVQDNDVDNDGLPDLWEARELLSYAFDGSADNDQDGISNAEELAQGTDPLLPNAIALGAISINAAAEEVLFGWQGTPGTSYAVEFTESLSAPDWTVLSIVNSGNEFDIQTTVSMSGMRGFYRIRKL